LGRRIKSRYGDIRKGRREGRYDQSIKYTLWKCHSEIHPFPQSICINNCNNMYKQI
jgi:hypothetical protein